MQACIDRPKALVSLKHMHSLTELMVGTSYTQLIEASYRQALV